MKLILFLSDAIIPLLVFTIVGTGLLCRRGVYDDFLKGAKKGLKTVVGILPTLIGLMMAVGILRASGFLELLSTVLGNCLSWTGFPAELVPLSVVKMFSSSAATGLLLDLYKKFGTDSRIGFMASIILSSTETIFYTMSLYYMTAGIKKTRYTLAGALVATIAGIMASAWITGIIVKY